MKAILKLGFILLFAAAISCEANENSGSDLLFQPNQASYLEGEEVTLICRDGTFSGDCTWLQDDQSIDVENDSRFQIDKTNSCIITISSLTSEDDSWWACQLTNGNSATKRLTIESKKIVQLIPREPEVIHVEDGGTAELQCLFNHSAPSCFWMKDDNVMAIRGRYRFIGEKNKGNCTIRINRVNYKDFGKWRCCYPMTDNEPALKSFSITLNITVVPTLPFITLNYLKVENEKPIFLETQTNINHIYNNYGNNYQKTFVGLSNDKSIACWILNGYPEAKLKWAIENENGNVLDYVDSSLTAKMWSVINTSNLKSTFLSFKFNENKDYEDGIRKVKLTCSATHPSFKNLEKTASIWLIWGHSTVNT